MELEWSCNSIEMHEVHTQTHTCAGSSERPTRSSRRRPAFLHKTRLRCTALPSRGEHRAMQTSRPGFALDWSASPASSRTPGSWWDCGTAAGPRRPRDLCRPLTETTETMCDENNLNTPDCSVLNIEWMHKKYSTVVLAVCNNWKKNTAITKTIKYN